MIADEIRSALKERLRVMEETDDNWDYGIDKCCKKKVKILSEDISETMCFLENECTDEEFFWLSEVFDDVSEKAQSKKFIQCLRERLARVRPENYDPKKFKYESTRDFNYDEYVKSINVDIKWAEWVVINDEDDE